MSIDINSLVEVTLNNPDDFLKVRETLTRIGVASKKEKTLYQSCHILQKQGRYYIVHFKELFALDGKPSNITESDVARRNTIIKLLKERELVDINEPVSVENPTAPISQIKVLPFKDKEEWALTAKYNIGKKKSSTDWFLKIKKS